MTRRIIAIIAGITLGSTSLSNAQDYSLSHFTADSNLVTLTQSELSGAVDVGHLPSSYLSEKSVTPAPTTTAQVTPASNPTANLAVLLGFASLLTIGGTITSLCVFSRRPKRQSITPMHMVGA